jgi:23S rRNA (guanosine2251-2'-O)-methyltransferase
MDDPTPNRPRRSRRRRKPRSAAGKTAQGHKRSQGRSASFQQDSRGGSGRPGNSRQVGVASRSVGKNQLPQNLVYGVNPVVVAIETGQLKVLFFDKGRTGDRLQHIHANALAEGIEIRPLAKQGWSRVLPGEAHQGIAGLIHELPNHFIEEIVAEVGDESCILVLDRIQDPQNLGAVLRTCAANQVDAVVLPKAGSCPISAAVHKASAGQSLRVRIVEGENLARTIEYLKDHGYWVIGCDSEGEEDATTFEYPPKRVIVMGNEGEGMRRLTRESCDYLVRIPMAQGVESLNISVATGVVLYLASADLARAASEEVSNEGADDGAD